MPQFGGEPILTLRIQQSGFIGRGPIFMAQMRGYSSWREVSIYCTGHYRSKYDAKTDGDKTGATFSIFSPETGKDR